MNKLLAGVLSALKSCCFFGATWLCLRWFGASDIFLHHVAYAYFGAGVMQCLNDIKDAR